VGAMEVAENVWGGRGRSDVADPGEIGGNVEHGGIAELRSDRLPGTCP